MMFKVQLRFGVLTLVCGARSVLVKSWQHVLCKCTKGYQNKCVCHVSLVCPSVPSRSWDILYSQQEQYSRGKRCVNALTFKMCRYQSKMTLWPLIPFKTFLSAALLHVLPRSVYNYASCCNLDKNPAMNSSVKTACCSTCAWACPSDDSSCRPPGFIFLFSADLSCVLWSTLMEAARWNMSVNYCKQQTLTSKPSALHSHFFTHVVTSVTWAPGWLVKQWQHIMSTRIT